MNRKRLVTYLVIGGSTYLFEMLVLWFVQHVLRQSASVSVAASFTLGMIAAFGLQKIVTFGDKRKGVSLLGWQTAVYTLLGLWNYTFTLFLVSVVPQSIPVWLVRTFAIGCITVWNYGLYHFIFGGYEHVPWLARLSATLKTASFQRWFFVATCAFAMLTTTIWTVESALLHMGNSDQLANTYMMQNPATAQLAPAHTFFMKLPLFWLNYHTGAHTFGFVLLTLLLVLATVGGFLYILTRIEKRPVVRGLLVLALSSVLCFLPAQPVAGALLPLNIAMLATRNIEYLFFVGALWLLVNNGRAIWRIYIPLALLTLLFMSDRLFVGLAAGAVGLLLFLALVWRREWLSVAGRVTSVVAMSLVVGFIAQTVLTIFGIVSVARSSSASPYAFTLQPKGFVYAVLETFTNFGANPAFDKGITDNWLATAIGRLASPTGVGYVTNLALCLVVLFAAWKCAVSVFRRTDEDDGVKPATLLSLMLVGASLAAGILFAVTHHDFLVDGRYLTIVLFTGFTLLALAARRLLVVTPTQLKKYYVVACIFVFSSLLGLVAMHGISVAAKSADAPFAARNHRVVATLRQYGITNVKGDYWRVYPLLSKDKKLHVLPLESCTEPRTVLTNKPVFSVQPYAYLVSPDGTQTDFPSCSVESVTSKFGTPQHTILVNGTDAQPEDYLLIYDPRATTQTATQLPGDSLCSAGTTLVVAAHEDDDLLFMNPTLKNEIAEGKCIRTIFLTAGDANQGRTYWVSRQLGSKAAYSFMTGTEVHAWTEIRTSFGDNPSVKVSELANGKVSLVFVGLPDGGVQGRGYAHADFGTLGKLVYGEIPALTTVDETGSFTRAQLLDVIANAIDKYHPDTILSQSNRAEPQLVSDHNDHLAVGALLHDIASKYPAMPVRFFLGYEVKDMPSNLDSTTANDKASVFLHYAAHDQAACQNLDQCVNHSMYGAFFSREYTE